MRATPTAELVEFQPVPRVRLVLRCHVVAAFALLARQRDRRSFVTCHLDSLRFVVFGDQLSVVGPEFETAATMDR